MQLTDEQIKNYIELDKNYKAIQQEVNNLKREKINKIYLKYGYKNISDYFRLKNIFEIKENDIKLFYKVSLGSFLVTIIPILLVGFNIHGLNISILILSGICGFIFLGVGLYLSKKYGSVIKKYNEILKNMEEE